MKLILILTVIIACTSCTKSEPGQQSKPGTIITSVKNEEIEPGSTNNTTLSATNIIKKEEETMVSSIPELSVEKPEKEKKESKEEKEKEKEKFIESVLEFHQTYYPSSAKNHPKADYHTLIGTVKLKDRPSKLTLGLYKYGKKLCNLLKNKPTSTYKIPLAPSSSLLSSLQGSMSVIELKRRAILFKYSYSRPADLYSKSSKLPQDEYGTISYSKGKKGPTMEHYKVKYEYVCSTDSLFKLGQDDAKIKLDIIDDEEELLKKERMSLLETINDTLITPTFTRDRTISRDTTVGSSDHHSSEPQSQKNKTIEEPKWNIDKLRLLTGLPNVGNTCFSNAMIQILMSISPFISDLSSEPVMKWCETLRSEGRESKSLLCEFSKVMKFLYVDANTSTNTDASTNKNSNEGEKRSKESEMINIKNVLRNIPIIITSSSSSGIINLAQNDSQEVWAVVLNLLDKEFSQVFGTGYNLMARLLVGKEEQSIVCLDARHRTKVVNWSDCLLPVEKNNLTEMLNDNYRKVELLYGTEKYLCEGCQNTKVDSGKWVRLEQPLPPIMQIHLKRMTADGRKINRIVAFPLELDFSPYVSNVAVAAATTPTQMTMGETTGEEGKGKGKEKEEGKAQEPLKDPKEEAIVTSETSAAVAAPSAATAATTTTSVPENKNNNEKSKEEAIVTSEASATSASNATSPTIASKVSPTIASNATSNGLVYELFGIIEHAGTSPSSGHYVAHVRLGESWYLFDDSSPVRKISKEDVLSKQAYVLFYKAKGLGFIEATETPKEPVKIASLIIPTAATAPPLPPTVPINNNDNSAGERDKIIIDTSVFFSADAVRKTGTNSIIADPEGLENEKLKREKLEREEEGIERKEKETKVREIPIGQKPNEKGSSSPLRRKESSAPRPEREVSPSTNDKEATGSPSLTGQQDRI